jgi:lysozyme family protein
MNRDTEQAPQPAGFASRYFNAQTKARAKALGATAAWNLVHIAGCSATVSGLIITGLTDTLNPLTGSFILMAAVAAEISGWYIAERHRLNGHPDYQPLYAEKQKTPRY